MQHHLAAQRAHGIHLDLGRGGGHHDHGAGAELAGAHGHALGMVAGRGADDAALQLAGGEVRHLVVGAAQLEAEHGLLVLALEQHPVVQAAAQVAGGFQVRLDRHVVHAGGEDLLEVIGGGQVVGHGRGQAPGSRLGCERGTHHRFPAPGMQAVPSAPSGQKKAPGRKARG